MAGETTAIDALRAAAWRDRGSLPPCRHREYSAGRKSDCRSYWPDRSGARYSLLPSEAATFPDALK